MNFRRARDGVSGEQFAQPDRFVAQIRADKFFALERAVALVKHQIDDFQGRFQPGLEFVGRGHFELDVELTQPLFRPRDGFCYGRFPGEKRPRDLGDAEAPTVFSVSAICPSSGISG